MSRVLTVNKLLVVLLGLASMLTASLTMAALKDEITERLQPAGQVCVMGTECDANVASVAGADSGPKDPAEVYNSFCATCHGTGVNNAPVFANAEAWAPRISKGVDVLYENAINGFNNGAMPPKGLCMACSDEDLHAVVDYMLEAAQ